MEKSKLTQLPFREGRAMEIVEAVRSSLNNIRVWQDLTFSGKDIISQQISVIVKLLETILQAPPKKDLDLQVNELIEPLYQVSEIFTSGIFAGKDITAFERIGTEYENLRTEVGRLEAELEQTKRQHDLFRSEEQGAQKELESLKIRVAELNKLQQKSAEDAQTTAELKRQLGQKNAMVKDLEFRLKQSLEQLDKLRDSQRQESEKTLARIREDANCIIHNSRRTSMELNNLASVIKTLESMVAELKSHGAEQNHRLSSFESLTQEILKGQRTNVSGIQPETDAKASTLKRFQQELTVLDEWLAQVRQQQNDFEALLDVAESENNSYEELLKLGLSEDPADTKRAMRHHAENIKGYREYLSSLLTLSSPFRQYRELLGQYFQLQAKLEQNTAPLELPPLPVFAAVGVTEADTPRPAETKELAYEPALQQNSRFQRLWAIADKYHIIPNAVFICSLYDLGDFTSQGNPRQIKSLATIVGAAFRSKLAQAFGMITPADMIRGATKEVLEEYLTYRGSLNSITILYARNEKSLPWAVYELFSDEEIEKFQKEIESAKSKK